MFPSSPDWGIQGFKALTKIQIPLPPVQYPTNYFDCKL